MSERREQKNAPFTKGVKALVTIRTEQLDQSLGVQPRVELISLDGSQRVVISIVTGKGVELKIQHGTTQHTRATVARFEIST